MNLAIRKILIATISLIGIGLIGYALFVGYVFYTFTSGCGMDDGPFEAQLLNTTPASDLTQTFELKEGQLIINNRKDDLSPVLTLIEQGEIKWTLEMDVSKNKGYETCRLWEISNVEILNNSDPIRFSFIGSWTYGAERGTMEIDRDDGDNSFCLSW